METAATAFLTVVGHGLWGSALILGITALCVKTLSHGGRLNATTRHTLWGACLMGIVLLHGALLASALSPSGAALADSEFAAASVAQPEFPTEGGTSGLAPGQHHSVASLNEQAPMADAPNLAAPLAPSTQSEQGAVAAAPGQTGQVAPSAAGGSANALQLPALAGPFAVLLAVVWLLGVAFGLWRLAVAASRVQILKRQSTVVPSQTRSRILARVSPLARDIDIATAPIGSPVAAGFRSPAVLMPQALLDASEEETFDQVALHEVAHLQRGDDWALLVQRVAEAILWFNPAVRAVGRWMESEREAACDEWVVSATREPVSYVRSLGRMIELRLVGSVMMAAPGLAAKESDIIARVKSLLEQGANATSREFRGRAAVAIGLVALVGVLSVLSAPSLEIDWSDSKQDTMRLVSAPQSPGLPPLPPLPPLPSLAPLAPTASPAPPASIAQRPSRPDAPAVTQFPTAMQAPPAPLASVPALGADPAASPAMALRAGPARTDLTVAGWIRLLKLAKSIPSDGDRARLLIDAAARIPSDQRVQAGLLDAARSIASSGDKKRVLMAYLSAQSPTGEAALDLIRTALTIPSSGDRARMLVAISQGVEQTAQVRSALLDAVDRIPSSNDRERVLRALTN